MATYPEIAMSVLSDFRVKEPLLDAPQAKVPENRQLFNGTRVALSSQGIQISAQITAVERLGTVFVGRVLGFSPATMLPDGVGRGDYIRFRQKDVHRID